RGLRGRLGQHVSGDRSGDKFCEYIAHLFVLPTLTGEEIAAIARRQLSLDHRVRAFVRDHLSYSFIPVAPDLVGQMGRSAPRDGMRGVGLPVINTLERDLERAGALEPAELDVRAAQRRIRDFVEAREWGKFHTPKNLVMALAGEVAELSEHFQWLTPEESASAMTDPVLENAISEELADVVYYVLRMADVLGINLNAALEAKMAKSELKHPIETSRGVATRRRD